MTVLGGQSGPTPEGVLATALEDEVTSELRRRGIVVWLDRDQHYTALVDRLIERRAAGDFAFPVVGFRGSFLELLVHLEPYGSGLDNAPLLIHMPGFTKESIRRTPVLDPRPGGCFWRLHPGKAYQWELRLQDEIREGFTIDEPDSDAARARFLAEHAREAAEIERAELTRRDRKAKKAAEQDDGPLFEHSDDDDQATPVVAAE